MEDRMNEISNEVSLTVKVNTKKDLIYKNSQQHNCESEMFTILSNTQKKSKSSFPFCPLLRLLIHSDVFVMHLTRST